MLVGACKLTKLLPSLSAKFCSPLCLRGFQSSAARFDLMEFFDDPKNWGVSEIKTGRPWKKEELRLKSNSDLHKLWFVLYKERNMLLTMQEAATDQVEYFPSPERIDKVEESMCNLEDVVKERNKAYWELEVGEGLHGERPRIFRKDQFGRWRWHGMSEHVIPFFMNPKWREINAPGFGSDVRDFIAKYREKRWMDKQQKALMDGHYCRQLLRRFPDLDIEYLKEKYPHVPTSQYKENLEWFLETDRDWRRYKKQETIRDIRSIRYIDGKKVTVHKSDFV